MSTETKHTKEPWYFDQKNTCISPVSDDQLEICSIQPIDTTAKAGKWFMFGEQSEANARRIVACVNACAGLSDEQLEDDKLDVFLQALRISSLEAQLADLSGARKADKADYLRQIKAYRAQNKELREAITEYIAVDGSNGKYNAMSLYDAKQRLDKALSGG